MEPDFAKKAKKQLANISPKDNHILPFESLQKEDNVIIVSREIESETFSKVIKNAKQIEKEVPLIEVIKEDSKEYQEGEQLDFWNVREYVLFRDGHTCQCCKGKSKD